MFCSPIKKKYTAFVSSLVLCPFHCYSTLTIIVSLSHFVVSIVITFRRFHPHAGIWSQSSVVEFHNAIAIWITSFLHRIRNMPDPTRAHLNNLTIPVGDNLCQQECNWLWDTYHVNCTVRYRPSWGRRAMSMNGDEENFEVASVWALDIMAEKVRIDVCM